MKNSEKQTKKWTRKTHKRNTQNKMKEKKIVRKKDILATHPSFSNDFFSHMSYLFLRESLWSTIRLSY